MAYTFKYDNLYICAGYYIVKAIFLKLNICQITLQKSHFKFFPKSHVKCVKIETIFNDGCQYYLKLQ